MNRKAPLKLTCITVTMAAVALLASGCSGINSGVGVSPASFLLPGLIMNDPQPAAPILDAPDAANTVVVAQNR